ncbi:Uncharacterised protein [Legionella busanensis]|uniref:Uncharacterized protein n=1 Tax=Legionella busanensis TaxID=190655 RepID=A0A378JIW0_9GAMM|nr:Uncharacterised protein [Legionella busanensis]
MRKLPLKTAFCFAIFSKICQGGGEYFNSDISI